MKIKTLILLSLIFVLSLSVRFSAFAQSDPCTEAKRLFNQSLEAKDIESELHLLKKAERLCDDPYVVAPVLNNIGDVYERMGKIGRAFWYYKRAVEIKPDQATTYFGAAHLYLKLGDFYSAHVVLKKGLEYDPDNLKIREELKSMEERLKDEVIVYFPFNSSELTAEAANRLRLFAENVLRGRESTDDLVFVIEGHTCDLGPESYNLILGRRRAEQVAQYLKRCFEGREPKMVIKSYGESAPLTEEKDPLIRKLNRRVRVRIQESSHFQGG